VPVLTKRLDGSTFEAQRAGLSRGDIAGVTLMATRSGASLRRFRNDATGRCLSIVYGSTYAAQVSCAYADFWYWFRHPQTGRRHLINARTGQCLHAPSASTGTALIDDSCRDSARQGFVTTFTTSRYDSPSLAHPIKNVGTGLCLSGPIGSSTVRQATCSSASINQIWTELAP
jgi:hypothetical protein